MIKILDTPEVALVVSEMPHLYVRNISPFDCKLIREDKKQFPYRQTAPLDFTVEDKINRKFYPVTFEDYINDEDSFKFDGASIPKPFHSFVGHNGNPKFLLAAFFHDIHCIHKDLIGYDRKLSSVLFKELLLSCGTLEWKANTMFTIVDLFQRTKKWKP